jgi:hypothetical protein
MSTRLISWQQLVTEADPDFSREANRPWIYRFSNERRFRRPANIYADYALVDVYMTDDFGNVMTDDYGNPIASNDPVLSGHTDFTSDFTSDFA